MALAIDASSPAVASGAGPIVTSAAFTPPANSVLEIGWIGDSSGTTTQPTITDTLGTPLTYTLTDWQSNADTPGVGGQAATWRAVVGGSPASMSVKITNNSGATTGAFKVWVLTGADTTTPIGAHGKSGSNSTASVSQSYTAQSTGGQGFIAVCDFAGIGNETAGTGCTVDGTGTYNAAISGAFARRTTADDTNGSSNSLNVTLPGTSTAVNWAYSEVKVASTAAPGFVPAPRPAPRRALPTQARRRVGRQMAPLAPAAVTASVPPQARVRAPAVRVPVWVGPHRRGTVVPVKPVAALFPPMVRMRAPAIRVPIWLRRRGALPQPVPPVAAPFAPLVRIREPLARIASTLWRRRGTTVPAALAATPAAPAFVPATARRIVRVARRVTRALTAVPTDQPVPLAGGQPRRPRPLRLPRRGTGFTPAPVAAPWPVALVRRLVRLPLVRRSRPTVVVGAPPAAPAAPVWPPVVLRRVARPPLTRRARITAPVAPTVAAPWPVPAIRRIVRVLFARRVKLTPVPPPPPIPAWPPPAVRHPVRLPWTRRAARRLARVFGATAPGPAPAAEFASDSSAAAMLATDQAASALVSGATRDVSFVEGDAPVAALQSQASAAQLRSGP